MAFWWVSQNKTFIHERAGEYLWAPTAAKSGNIPFHWDTMRSVAAGDIVFSYASQKIPTISVAQTAAYSSPQPGEFGEESAWNSDGLKIDLKCKDLDLPLDVPSVVRELTQLLPSVYSPINRNGTGNQGYLFGLPDEAGRFLLECIGNHAIELPEDLVADAISRSSQIPATEREAIVKSRRGQGRFRDDLIRYWQGSCAVTGTRAPELLRASHIKPWSVSDNAERLDTYNGLLLTAQYDAAFDAGLVTFEDSGDIKLSDEVVESEFVAAGISASASLSRIEDNHRLYLSYHRRNVFRYA